MSEATVTAVEVRLPEPEPSKFERERRAFYRLLPELLATHRGQYVAVHDERVVDSGPVRLELALRVLDRVRAAIYVGIVDVEPKRVCRSGVVRDLSLNNHPIVLDVSYLVPEVI